MCYFTKSESRTRTKQQNVRHDAIQTCHCVLRRLHVVEL